MAISSTLEYISWALLTLFVVVLWILAFLDIGLAWRSGRFARKELLTVAAGVSIASVTVIVALGLTFGPRPSEASGSPSGCGTSARPYVFSFGADRLSGAFPACEMDPAGKTD